jgi:predicted TPR repeat methyltransferase
LRLPRAGAARCAGKTAAGRRNRPAQIMNSHNGYAREYDADSARYEWHGPEVIFGLVFDFLSKGQALLDIGIGTGLSSLLFHKAGIIVDGFDTSKDMLEVCRSKNFARDLTHHDVHSLPLPYDDGAYDYVIASGIFHFLEDLGPIMKEASRILKPGGIFVFTFEKHKLGSGGGSSVRAGEVSKRADEDSGFEVFRHSEGYVNEVLRRNAFKVLKKLEFVATVHPETGTRVDFKAIVARKA